MKRDRQCCPFSKQGAYFDYIIYSCMKRGKKQKHIFLKMIALECTLRLDIHA